MTQPWLDEAITVTLDDDGSPSCFMWRAQRHEIAQILKRWELDADWWRADGYVYRLYLAVLTDRKLLCVIYHDHLRAQWRLLRLYD